MWNRNFDVAEGKDSACRHFYDKNKKQKKKNKKKNKKTTDNIKTTRYRGHQWFEIAQKSMKLGHFNDRVHFYPMQIVAPLTSRTNDVRSIDTNQR